MGLDEFTRREPEVAWNIPASMCGGRRVRDFKQTFDEARDRLVAELYRTVDEPGFDAPQRDVPKFEEPEPDPGWKPHLAEARVEHFAETDLESLRKLSADLLERATELDREVA